MGRQADRKVFGQDAGSAVGMDSPPLIGITTGSRDNFPNRPERYIQAVQKAGGVAEFIYPGTGKKGLIDHYDGFLIPGGKDISPLRYNEEQLYEINPEEERRTAFELSLLKNVIQRKKPVLGICYGMQVINIYFRGTLYQDIASQKEDACDHRRGPHELSVQQNPYLKSVRTEVNSSHHQAVKKAGKGCVPFAFSQDGIIEGLYLSEYPFVVGVQWHPERMENEISDMLFRIFVEASGDH